MYVERILIEAEDAKCVGTNFLTVIYFQVL